MRSYDTWYDNLTKNVAIFPYHLFLCQFKKKIAY